MSFSGDYSQLSNDLIKALKLPNNEKNIQNLLKHALLEECEKAYEFAKKLNNPHYEKLIQFYLSMRQLSDKIAFDPIPPTDQEVVEKIRSILKSTPDYIVTVEDKFKFIKFHFILPKHAIKSLYYDESLPALSLQKMKTKISLAEYQKATREKLNDSDYIILSLGLLRQLIKNDVEMNERLNNIESEYFELNYEACIEEIKEMCTRLKEDTTDSNVRVAFESIIEASNNCIKVDLKHNDTRRYFGTKLSQYILGSVGLTEESEMLRSIQTVSKAILGSSADKKMTAEEAEETMASLAEHYSREGLKRMDDLKRSGKDYEPIHSWAELDSPEYLKRIEKLQEQRKGKSKFKTRKRKLHEKFHHRSDEAASSFPEFSRDAVYSMNLGELRSTSPNFRDEITEYAIRNRVVDVHDLKKLSTKIKRRSYVSGISGHAYYVVALLEMYLKNLRRPEGEPDLQYFNLILQRDINNFLIAFAGTYAKRGFHSMHEVLEVLREPHIILLFKDLGVDLNLKIDPKLLNYAVNDALAYSKATTIRRQAHTEFEKNFKVFRHVIIDKKMQNLIEQAQIEINRNQKMEEEGFDIRKSLLDAELKALHELISGMNSSKFTENYEDILPMEQTLQILLKYHQSEDLKQSISKILKEIDKIKYIYHIEHFFKLKDKLKDPKKIEQLLSEDWFLKDINNSQVSKNNFLIRATEEGYNDLVLALIKKGADRTAIGAVMGSTTPLVIAAKIGNFELVERLLKDTPLMGPEKDSPLLFECASKGQTDIVSLLLKQGANPLRKQGLGIKGVTPLIAAVRNNHISVVHELINSMNALKEENPDLVNNQFQLAFAEAIKEKSFVVINELMKAGIDMDETLLEKYNELLKSRTDRAPAEPLTFMADRSKTKPSVRDNEGAENTPKKPGSP